jgi:hypothetical protein
MFIGLDFAKITGLNQGETRLKIVEGGFSPVIG